MDFVGQKPPTSKLSLLILDVVVVTIQCLMLAVHQERERLRTLVLPVRRNAANSENTPLPAVTSQDHDAEERGTLRDGPATADETSDIELRSMSDSRVHRGGASEEAASLLESGPSDRPAAPDLTGVLRSGNAIIGDFHVIHAIRSAIAEQQGDTENSLQTIGYTATLAAMAAERRARLQTQRRQ